MAINRREFLSLSLAMAALPGCDRIDVKSRRKVPVRVHYPGMTEGHWLRDNPPPHRSGEERQVGTVIIGSGIAGITAAWKLAREGYRDFLLMSGPELQGNAAGGRSGAVPYPTGAHYLPLPSRESFHVREILQATGILLADSDADYPEYDETALVHAPDERLLVNGRWQEGLVPAQGMSATDLAQQAKFFAFTESLKNRKGRDGRPLFAIPQVLSSQDEEWRALDRLDFSAWLQQQGFTAPGLLWYLSYCCRDDYGAELPQVSAWAGLHYFACRSGRARNAGDQAVLTWPDGLGHLAGRMLQQPGITLLPGFAFHIEPYRDGLRDGAKVRYMHDGRITTLSARHVVIATPLHVTRRILPTLADTGFDPAVHMPGHAPWMVGNFSLHQFPGEAMGAPLAWDNVVYQGRGLGYVVATHQWIRSGRPQETVFTAYQALSAQSPVAGRRWLHAASTAELSREISNDLQGVYGGRFWRHVTALDITVRGHAMAIPAPGHLSNKGLAALQQQDGPLLFAHSDLSGYSVFEEASWWGYQAARKILGA